MWPNKRDLCTPLAAIIMTVFGRISNLQISNPALTYKSYSCPFFCRCPRVYRVPRMGPKHVIVLIIPRAKRMFMISFKLWRFSEPNIPLGNSHAEWPLFGCQSNAHTYKNDFVINNFWTISKSGS